MAYNDQRAYLGTTSLAAQNVVMTASGQIAPGTTTSAGVLTGEATFLCSITGYLTATPANFPAGVKPYAIIGTQTFTGQNAFAQSSASSAVSSFSPTPPIPAASFFSVGLLGTGTASATQTLGATALLVGIGPQFV
jgi:hypothetical protein